MSPSARRSTARAFDLVNERAYLVQLTSFPAAFVQTKDVKVRTDAVGALSVDFSRLEGD